MVRDCFAALREVADNAAVHEALEGFQEVMLSSISTAAAAAATATASEPPAGKEWARWGDTVGMHPSWLFRFVGGQYE